MAEDGMSMIPYHGSSNLDVVLRHNDSVVVLDRDSQQLALRNAASSDNGIELTDCPYCHRPIRGGSQDRDTHHASASTQPEFVNPEYFRLLHNSLPSSADSSGPPSPRRRLVQPALAGPTSDPEYTHGRTNSTQGISSAAFSPNYFKKFFVEEAELGRGGKGVVLLVKHVLDGVPLGHYACKRVPVGDDHEWLEKVLIEVQLLQHLSHQNLVSYRHVWLENAKISTFGPSVPCAFILQQYCNAGDLHNYICGSMQTSTTTQQLKERLRRKSKGEPEPTINLAGPRRLNFEEIYSFFRDITSGLRHLHVNGYIHRDLKPSNCLLHETGDGLRVLVSDFGEVQFQDAMRKSTGATGTVSYCAPEVLKRDYPGGPFGNFTFKSDIFSLGMILYFLCFAELPYRNADIINEEKEDLDQLREEISQWGGFDDARRMRPDLPEKLYTFLKRLLSVDPNRRPSADEVLNGIQAGVNGGEHFRFKRASSAGPDLHPSSRIRPVDSPMPASPAPSVPRTSLSPVKNMSRNLAVRRGSVFDSEDIRPSQNTVSDTDSESSSVTSPERDLIIRPRFSPPPPLSSNQAQAPEPDHESKRECDEDVHVHTPQLLPPPPSRRSFLHIQFPCMSITTAGWQLSSPFIQLVLFLFKVVSVFQPCSPLAVNPWVFYPLLMLAAVNLWTGSVKFQIISMVVHLATIAVSARLGALCIWYSTTATVFGL
ncbi:hypothetical protein ASPZODRAFT_71092 [Penicilliopsis zonata CBS 506.65]|uniref:non-specific serine/threonine protein kinase n=1 Tax=Penicilliopsis zonata CBS 506.65 TaxID=1073090 RepID=A0A1L9SBJ6_9EURO|nr:hypothetical protein ASPZODRAFT_71092 [Penicilliopsis zonata CBS 506.65]OJJ44526.1 hypothetical protein ASPZODRAFT_71092 [Penicilliopsis zonata CBS 506.65]